VRAEGRAGAVASASVAPEQRTALDRVAQLTATMKRGERAGAGLTQREAERETDKVHSASGLRQPTSTHRKLKHTGFSKTNA